MKDVPIEFVETVLGILEHFDLIKMCLLLCNSFKLNNLIGRYLVSSCLKYSNLSELRYKETFQQPRKMCQVYCKQRQNSIIAHEALHNVLSLISPKYLTLKSFSEPLTNKNSIGIDNYRLILSLGFWKKLVYILNGKMGMQLCLKFNDLTNFQILQNSVLRQLQTEEELASTDQQLQME